MGVGFDSLGDDFLGGGADRPDAGVDEPVDGVAGVLLEDELIGVSAVDFLDGVCLLGRDGDGVALVGC